MLNGKRILLVIGGGIAAYKSLELIRRLRERGATVRCVLTAGGAEFVTALSVAALSEEKVYSDLFSLTDEAEMGHIRLSREADLILIAPATADLLAKLAHGRADDLASTMLLAATTQIMAAPAMNVAMWENPATQANIETLKARGCLIVGPNEGDMACGEYGFGRLAEPEEMRAAVEDYFNAAAPLSGVRALVTSGPTHEPIDPVRFIGNRSSGRQGHAIAAALAGLGAEVQLVTGPVALADPAGCAVTAVQTAAEMLAACEAALAGGVDVAVCAAAVGDWRVAVPAAHKLKKDTANRDGAPAALELTENPDILHEIARSGARRPRLVVGFAAETRDLIDNATAKLARKGCDWIVANDVGPETGVLGGSENTAHLVRGAEVTAWPKMSKTDLARRLAGEIVAALRDAPAVSDLAAARKSKSKSGSESKSESKSKSAG